MATTTDLRNTTAIVLADNTTGQIGAPEVRGMFNLVATVIDDLPTGGASGRSISPRSYGATGDGVTDDTAAIIAAIAAALAQNQELHFDTGVYVFSQVSFPSAAVVRLDPGARLLRHPTTPTGNWLTFNANALIYGGGTVDANRENTATGCHAIRIFGTQTRIGLSKITVRGAKAVSGWGDGVSWQTGQGAGQHMVSECTFDDNDGTGLNVSDGRDIIVFNSRANRNGGNGFRFNNFDTTFAQKLRSITIQGNTARNNASSGIGVGNLVEDNNISTARRKYSFENMEASDIVIQGNVCEYNAVYGIGSAARGISILGNTVRYNGTVGNPNGGILTNSYRPSIIGNVVESNIGYGVDSGGSFRSIIEGNTISWNTGTAISIECSNIPFVSGNKIMDNGDAGTSESAAGSVQIQTWKSGGDGNGNFFPMICVQPHITGNQFILSQFRVGVRLDNGVEEPIVTNNIFWTTSPALAVRDFSKWAVISGNKVRGSSQSVLALTGTVLNVPDILEDVTIDPASNPTITGIRTISQAAVGMGLAYIDVTNAGSGYSHTSPPTVSITGGGGSGATAVVRLWEGTVIDIVITGRGSGYTSTPTVTISGGGGSGATGVAKVGQTMRDDKKLSILANSPCTIAIIAADGPNIVQPAAGNIAMPTHGVLSLIGRFAMGSTGYGQWRVLSKNF